MAAVSTLNGPGWPSPELVRAELRRICNSAVFASAPRLQKLLAYLVEEGLAGNPLKESIVGVAVFGRDPGYDPKQDSVVRTEVRRLRAKLIEYYSAHAQPDGVIIDLPKGSYVPAARFREIARPLAPPPAAASGPRLRWSASLAIAALLVLAAAILAGYRWRKPAAAPIARRSVAVLDFRNLTTRPETVWLATAIPEMISADLAGGQQIRTIPGENIARMEAELTLRPAASHSPETLAAIRRNLGADIVVSGAYADVGTGAGSRVRVDIWAGDARTGELIASVSETGAEPEILDLMTRAGARLRAGFRFTTESAGDLALRQASPEDPAAARAYAGGLASLRRGDLLPARDLLQQALNIEPAFAPAHAALSSAHAKLGYEKLAREEGRRAYDLSRAMAGEELRLAMEAQFYETNQQPARAAEVYRHLFARHPDDVEYGLHLAAAQTASAKTDEALLTVDALRKLPAPEASDPRIDMEAARALASRSDYRQSVQLAAEAARKAAAVNARLIYARALSLGSGLYVYLGDPRWRSLSEQARAICQELQDKACVAAILRRFGNISLGALDLDSADRYYAQALAIAREIGSAAEEDNVLNGMALESQSRGDMRQSVAIYGQLLVLNRQTGNAAAEQRSLCNQAQALLFMGQVDAAQQSAESAVKIARALGAREALADDLANLADVYRVQGDLPRALDVCRQGLNHARTAGTVTSQIVILERMARVLLAQDDLPGAQAAFREYNRLRAGGVEMAAWTDWLLEASLALAAHQPAQAAALASGAARQTSAHHLPWEQARAEALLAESLLVQGERVKACAAADRAWARLRRNQIFSARMEVGISYARVTGRREELPSLIAAARASHAFAWEMEGRLAEAQLSQDGARLAAVRTEALAHGLRYLARRADEAATLLK